jgi:putative FmdB family regulatory protein
VPTYQYTCTDCGEQVEVVQKFSDEPLKVCPVCGGALRKVFSPVGIVFKGSGFYRTDSRNGSAERAKKDKEPSGSGAKSGESGGGSGDSGSSGSGSKDSGSSGSSSDSSASGSSGSGSSGSGSSGSGSSGSGSSGGKKGSSSSSTSAASSKAS